MFITPNIIYIIIHELKVIFCILNIYYSTFYICNALYNSLVLYIA
jgi:hypothetical protein